MAGVRDIRAKEIKLAIRDVLIWEWDPLKIRNRDPEDEYDSYIAPIYRLLVTKAPREAVAHELCKIEHEQFGINNVEEEALLPVADLLLEINVSITS
jgi:hypothetical protein